jgi:hypothetical protein
MQTLKNNFILIFIPFLPLRVNLRLCHNADDLLNNQHNVAVMQDLSFCPIGELVLKQLHAVPFFKVRKNNKQKFKTV